MNQTLIENQRLARQLDFLIEMDRLKGVLRRSPLADGSRVENSAEHSWHLALMAIVLSACADEPVDAAHVIRMLLVHDIVEIDAGDTYAYDAAGNRDKAAREQRAADRLFGLLPDDQAAGVGQAPDGKPDRGLEVLPGKGEEHHHDKDGENVGDQVHPDADHASLVHLTVAELEAENRSPIAELPEFHARPSRKDDQSRNLDPARGGKGRATDQRRQHQHGQRDMVASVDPANRKA